MPSMLLAAAGILLVLLSSGDRAEAAPGLRLIAPEQGRTVAGKVRFAARVAGGTRRVAFYVDGRRRWVDRSRPWRFRRHGRLDTRRLSNGRHRLGVRVRRVGGRRQSVHRLIDVKNAKPPGSPRRKRRRTPDPPPSTAPPPSPARPPVWRSGFESGDFSEWSHWRQDEGGTYFAATAASQGIPAHSGAWVGRFDVSAAQQAAGNYHSKLFKGWAIAWPETVKRDNAGRVYERLPNNSPAGVYAAWFYLPPNNEAGRAWTNIFQFKESFLRTAGDPDSWEQPPTWWINLIRRATGPALIVNNWSGNPIMSSERSAPTGRWFEIKADLYPGDRIDWYVDGQLWYRAQHSTWPVGFSHPNAVGWTFGVGHYGGVGSIWVDDASFTTR